MSITAHLTNQVATLITIFPNQGAKLRLFIIFANYQH
nr:MAG TPA: hypothetical protein [Caudoviricetes sp.]